MSDIEMQGKADAGRKRLFQLVSIEIIVISCLFIGSLFLFAVIMHEAVYEKEEVFDNAVFAFFGPVSTPGFMVHILPCTGRESYYYLGIPHKWYCTAKRFQLVCITNWLSNLLKGV